MRAFLTFAALLLSGSLASAGTKIMVCTGINAEVRVAIFRAENGALAAVATGRTETKRFQNYTYRISAQENAEALYFWSDKIELAVRANGPSHLSILPLNLETDVVCERL